MLQFYGYGVNRSDRTGSVKCLIGFPENDRFMIERMIFLKPLFEEDPSHILYDADYHPYTDEDHQNDTGDGNNDMVHIDERYDADRKEEQRNYDLINIMIAFEH